MYYLETSQPPLLFLLLKEPPPSVVGTPILAFDFPTFVTIIANVVAGYDKREMILCIQILQKVQYKSQRYLLWNPHPSI